MQFRVTAPLVATTILLVIASQTQASIFRAEVSEYTYGTPAAGGPYVGSSPVESPEVSGVPGFSAPHGSYTGKAAADRGLLRARMAVDMPALFVSDVGARNSSAASFFLDDLMITGPVGGPATVAATMIVRGDGELSYAGQGTASIYLRLVMGTAGESFSPAAAGLYVFGDGPNTAGTGFDFLAGLTGSGGSLHGLIGFTSTLSTTSPNGVGITIIAGAETGKYFGGSASSDFFDTVHFPADGPVFVLPAGYTANSVSGNIVDNRWLGPVTAAPEPASLGVWLGLLAAASMSAGAIRRQSRSE